jgi:hypothetical protein
MTTADFQCSRCGSWHGNPSCYVCGTDAEDEPCWDEPHAWETETNETRTENETE